ncbi:unnamed protein product [Parnassius mnemosyne]|uniref:Uncharacterized protein n=1 Tax=Parnassius mnemosyne TaxID=213953 RepID=A0AAV1LAC6_9NEOP
MALSEGEVCRICLSVNIRMFALKETGLQNLYKTLTNSFSIPEPHKVRGEIKFTPIYHIDIWPVECDIDNDCKYEIFCLDAVKVEEEIFEYENSKLEVNENHETGKIYPLFAPNTFKERTREGVRLSVIPV